jgi:hypothetical protein
VQKDLLYPMVGYIFYMGAIAILNLTTRVSAVRRRELSPKYFQLYQGEGISERVLVVGRHYDNQFQLPLLFLIVCVAHLSLNLTSSLTVWFAWGFVISRMLHSTVHLGDNHVLRRFSAFGLGWVFVIGMAAQLILAAPSN